MESGLADSLLKADDQSDADKRLLVPMDGGGLNDGGKGSEDGSSHKSEDDDEGEPRTCCGYSGPFADETNRMFALAWPVAIGYLSTSAMTTVDLAFVGHLGKTELAAMSVSNVVLMGTFGEPDGLARRGLAR